MFTTIDKALAGAVVSAAVTFITQHTGLAVPMEWVVLGTATLTGVLTGFFTWLIPNKPKTT